MILWIARWKFEGNENAECPFELRIDSDGEHYHAPETEADAEDTYTFHSTRKDAMSEMRLIEQSSFLPELPYRNKGFIELWRLEASKRVSDIVTLANDSRDFFDGLNTAFGRKGTQLTSPLNRLALWQYTYDEVTRHPAGRAACDVYHRKVTRSSTTMKAIRLAAIVELSKQTTARIDANTSDPGAIVRAAREAVAKLEKENA